MTFFCFFFPCLAHNRYHEFDSLYGKGLKNERTMFREGEKLKQNSPQVHTSVFSAVTEIYSCGQPIARPAVHAVDHGTCKRRERHATIYIRELIQRCSRRKSRDSRPPSDFLDQCIIGMLLTYASNAQHGSSSIGDAGNRGEREDGAQAA